MLGTRRPAVRFHANLELYIGSRFEVQLFQRRTICAARFVVVTLLRDCQMSQIGLHGSNVGGALRFVESPPDDRYDKAEDRHGDQYLHKREASSIHRLDSLRSERRDNRAEKIERSELRAARPILFCLIEDFFEP